MAKALWPATKVPELSEEQELARRKKRAANLKQFKRGSWWRKTKRAKG